MNKQWAPGFTIVEIIIVVIVVGILMSIVTLGYSNVRRTAMLRAVQSDLQNVSTAMEQTIQKTSAYPTSLPSEIKASDGVTLTIVSAGAEPYYDNITPVQNGVLFAQICADLVNEGVGQGVNQGGGTENYITGCGNWNNNSMQITGWNSRVWNTPVDSAPLLAYAESFTTNDTWNKAQEAVVKEFYTELVERFERQGGSFPITTFWDYWATPQNGGVIAEPLPTSFKTKPYYCAEGSVTNTPSVVWHITQEKKLTAGSC